MAQFSMKIMRLPGSVLGENQQLGFGENDFALGNTDLSVSGNYSSRSFLVGGSLSGLIEREGFEIRPEIAIAYGRTDMGGVTYVASGPEGTADLMARIDGVNYATVRITPEFIIPFDFSGIESKVTLAPSLICEWADGSGSCGGGLELSLQGQTVDALTTYKLILDADHISGIRRTGLTFNLVHQF